MYACGPNSKPTPVAATNTKTTWLDPFHLMQHTLTTLSDVGMITGIEIVHIDCLAMGVTEVSATMIILRDGEAKECPIVDGLLPLGERMHLLLPSATKETDERPGHPQASSFLNTIDWAAIPGLISAGARSLFSRRRNGNNPAS